MQSIHIRAPEVADRVIPGHWEGDLIKGAAYASSIGILVERTYRFVVLDKMPEPVRQLIAFLWRSIDNPPHYAKL